MWRGKATGNDPERQIMSTQSPSDIARQVFETESAALKQMRDALDKVLDGLDDNTALDNGLRFELETARAMLDALPDNANKWEQLAGAAMNLYDMVNDKSIEAAGNLLQTCIKAITTTAERDP